jgi:hypothetical protein
LPNAHIAPVIHDAGEAHAATAIQLHDRNHERLFERLESAERVPGARPAVDLSGEADRFPFMIPASTIGAAENRRLMPRAALCALLWA